MTATGLAFGETPALAFPCGNCANCLQNARDAEDVARLNAQGYGGEIVGSQRTCSRYEHYIADKTRRERLVQVSDD